MVRNNPASNYGSHKINILWVSFLISSLMSVCSIKVTRTTDSVNPALYIHNCYHYIINLILIHPNLMILTFIFDCYCVSLSILMNFTFYEHLSLICFYGKIKGHLEYAIRSECLSRLSDITQLYGTYVTH